MNTVGRKIRTVRVWRGIRQQELADRAGIKRTYISQFENGETELTAEDLESVKKVLGIQNLSDPIDKILAELAPESIPLAA